MTSPKTTTTTTSGKDSKADCVEEELKQFDFVQFCVPDIHGIPRGRLVPSELLAGACRDGVGIFSGRSLAHSNPLSTMFTYFTLQPQGPGEMKRREVSWILKRAQERSRVGRWSWAQKVGLLLLQLFLSSCTTNIVILTGRH